MGKVFVLRVNNNSRKTVLEAQLYDITERCPLKKLFMDTLLTVPIEMFRVCTSLILGGYNLAVTHTSVEPIT